MNIRIVCILSFALLSCPTLQLTAEAAKGEGEYVSLFDGHDLKGWDGDPKFWSVVDGTIVGETTDENPASNNTFLVYEPEKFTDFELRFSFKVQGFNSGVQYRSTAKENWGVTGPQADFEAKWHDDKESNENKDQFSGMVYDEGGRGFLAQRGEAVVVLSNPEEPQKPVLQKFGSLGDPTELGNLLHHEDWNEYKVVAIEDTMVHSINGRVMSLCIDQDEANFQETGVIAFQLHSGPPMRIQLKDIRIRKFD